jgi:hypothetical protein
MERAPVWFVVSPEKDVLSWFDFCKYISAGDGVLFQVFRIVAQIASANIHCPVTDIEYLKPAAVNAKIILKIFCIGYQQLIQTQIYHILPV